ncbi:uncharacterized protein [Temnothorax longispinosus]|uniref:uncharacterized protein isoform X1 n=1 Tax=Temnothorax longispinosus TaxID=300112 RepID=UPI003A99F294
MLFDITIPVSSATSDSIDLTRISDSTSCSSFASSEHSFAPFAHTSSNLVDLDLRQILQKKYPTILSLLIEKKQIGWCDKQRLNRLFVSAFTDKYGPFPSTAQKASLAQLIIQEFPSLTGHEGRGYGGTEVRHLDLLKIESETGGNVSVPGIKQRLKYNHARRKQLMIVIKETTIRHSGKNTEISQEVLQMQQWLKENSTPKSIVIERMRDTAAARDVFIFDEKHTLTEILDAWPRLLEPEIIDAEFVRRYSQQQGDALCSEFGLLSERIIFQAKNCGRTGAEKFAQELSAQDFDRSLTALRLLPFLLPQTVVLFKEQGKKETVRIKPTSQVSKLHFIDVVPETTNLDYYLANDRLGPDKRRKQPFILLTGEESRPTQVFIIVENHAINAPTVFERCRLMF